MTVERDTAHAAYVLHSHPYRETSLLVDVFTRGRGRLTLVARGARRPRSVLRGQLMSFQPLALSWFGKGEVRTLSRAEWVVGQPLLAGRALLCGFYLNELLQRLLPRDDAHEALFEAYTVALTGLSRVQDEAPVLRRFERALLKELGYALTLEHEIGSGQPIVSGKTYTYEPERGPVPAAVAGRNSSGQRNDTPLLDGQALLDIARDDFSNPSTLVQAKSLMRALINHRLEYRPLQSRRIFQELQDL
jgi:DNA repair protein RecO (recombination protein O)